MRIVIVSPPDRRRPIAALRHVSRWSFRACYAVGAVVLTLGLVSVIALPGDPVLDVVIILLGLACLAYPTWVEASVRRQQRDYAAMEIEYEIDEDGITTRTAHGASAMRWSAIERAALLPDLLLLWVSRNQYFPIPVDALAPEDRADLADLLERQGLPHGDRTRLWTTSDPDPR
ncbi:YcxB family protein [Asanoa sp. NPDC050611]|uniref:YcxB family protein n=1 Tax=Asanoa sp. NPDC050611 TaxID=3157098 RepID=UPI00340A19D5